MTTRDRTKTEKIFDILHRIGFVLGVVLILFATLFPGSVNMLMVSYAILSLAASAVHFWIIVPQRNPPGNKKTPRF